MSGPTNPGSPSFVLEPDHEPSAWTLYRSGAIHERVKLGLEELADCTACPRNCHVNRLEDQAKVCGTGRHAIVSSAFPHHGEEDCLRGTRGSGTIFFSLCNLRCVFCQNHDISQVREGTEMTGAEIADVMLALQNAGCHNINFVTPEHVVPQVIEAIEAALDRGLNLPIVYNTSAYDSLGSLRMLDGLVDIYMPDFKFWSKASAKMFAKAKDYPERAREAVLEMHRQVGPLMFDDRGLARRGLLVRHLVMPGQTEEAEAIFRFLHDEVSPDTYVNIMDQYRPAYATSALARDGTPKYASIDRMPTQAELRAARRAAEQAGLWRFDERLLQLRRL